MSSWRDIAAAKRAAQAQLIPDSLKLPSPPGAEVLNVVDYPLDSVLSARDLEITGAQDITTLLAKLASGEWSAVETCRAFCNRALVAHQLVNCLTEIFVDQAMERAKELDEHLAKTGKTVGPLHGLPISLKDQISTAGTDTSMGYVGWLNKPAIKNAVVADCLLAQGAILYVRTNVPQTLMLTETDNNVFGRTDNPYNRSLTCGGSSGGEGALIGLRGSLLGVGSDIGGSIRIPAAFNGLYGLRPSYNRVPYEGAVNSLLGQESIFSVLGPISASLDGLKISMQAIAASKPWLYDPLVIRLPWSESEYALSEHGGGEKLCFAMQWDDGFVKPHPPYKRAMEMTKKALEAAGHTVINWESYQTQRGLGIIVDIFQADGGEDINRACALSGEPRNVGLAPNSRHLSTYQYWQVCLDKQKYMKEHLDHWQATASRTGTGRPIDAIIAPVNASPPSPHGQSQYVYYTCMSNVHDYATSVFPVLQVDPSVDKPEPAHQFMSSLDEKIHGHYSDPELYRDAPIGLQCIGRKNEEEAVIRMTEIIDTALKSYM